MTFIKKKDNFIFVAPSKRIGKKYDVYDLKKKYVTSFGSINHEHYRDKIGYYKKLNHYDKDRRFRYRQRHINDYISDPSKAGYFAWKYLW